MCIHRNESVDWHKRTDWLGRPSRDHGGLQIDIATWFAYLPAGYPTDPADGTPRQQLTVGYRIWQHNGWAPWPRSSRTCRLR